jgi:hypothetical protein
METGQHWDRLPNNQPAEITLIQISEVQESPAFNGRRSFLALRRGGGTRWDRQFESCPERPPLPKRPVNLEGGINQRVRGSLVCLERAPWRRVTFRNGTPCFVSN